MINSKDVAKIHCYLFLHGISCHFQCLIFTLSINKTLPIFIVIYFWYGVSRRFRQLCQFMVLQAAFDNIQTFLDQFLRRTLRRFIVNCFWHGVSCQFRLCLNINLKILKTFPRISVLCFWHGVPRYFRLCFKNINL